MKLQNSRLSTRIIIAAIVLVVTGAVTLMFIENARLHDVYLSGQRARLEEKLHAEKLRISQAVNVLRQDVLFLSNTPPVSGIVRAALNRGYDARDGNTRERWEARLQQIFSAFLAAHPNCFQVRYIGVADGGRELVRVDNRAGKPEITPQSRLQAKGDRDYFKATLGLHAGEVFLSEFGFNREWGVIEQPHRPSLRASTPVFTPSGQIFGMVVINMDAGYLLASAASSLPAGVQAYIANMSGEYLLHPDARRSFGFELDGKDKIATDFPLLETIFNPQASEHLPLQAASTEKDSQYFAAERIHFDPGNPARFLLLAYHLPSAVAARQVATIPARHIIGGFIAMLLVGGIALLVLRRTFAPLEQLTAVADKIAAGNYEVTLPQNGSGEIGSLIRALSAMLAELAQREKEILRVNAGLEERVKERTIELEQARQITEGLLHELSTQQIELEMQNYELQRAQIIIEESRDRYADLYDFAPVGYLTLTREALISEINLTGAALLGKERDKLIQSRFARLVTPEDGDRWHRHFMDMLQRDGQRGLELVLQRGDGSNFHAQLDCLRLISDGGVPLVRITLADITKRKRAEMQSAKSLSLLYTTLESTNDAILVVDLNSTWVLHNQRFIDLWHIPDEIIAARDDGAALSYVLSQLEDADGFLKKVRELYATPEASSFDTIKFKDGRIIERDSMPQRIDGKVVGRVWSFRDITGRKQAEAVLMQHKVVIDTSIDGFWITDMRGNLLEANAAYAKISGYPIDELVGMHVSQLEAKEQTADVKAHIAKIIAQGYDRFETRHRRKDGHEIDIEVSTTYLAELQQLAVFCRDITKRKQANEALRIAAAAFETLDAIMITDADGNIIQVNQAFSAITGYSPEEVLGKNLDKMNSGQDGQGSCIEMLQQSIRDGSWAGEIWDKRKDGRIYPKWMTVTAVKNERQEITHYVLIFSDITERKQVEEARLRASDERFRGTLEQVAVGIAHASLDGHFQHVNQKFCAITGYTRDELLQMSFHDITFPGDLDENLRYIRQLLAGAISTYSMEKRYVRKNRSMVWVNLTVSLLRDADGTPKYTIGVIEDITERKQAEAWLQQFSNLLQNSFDEIYVLDAYSLYFLLTSEGAERNLGYSSDELNRLTLLDLCPSLTRESFGRMLAQLDRDERPSLFLETVLLRKNSTAYPVEMRLQFMGSDNPVFMAIAKDITERKSSERRLRDLSAHLQTVREEEKARVAREIHDDLGGTLTALKMDVYWLADELSACGGTARLLGHIESMSQLLDNAVEVTRRVITDLRPTILDDLGLQAALEWQAGQFQKRTGIRCSVTTCTCAGCYKDELGKEQTINLFRILQESLTNVARHSGASSVEIELQCEDGEVILTIGDNGCGLPEGHTVSRTSYGMLGMRERVWQLGGRINFYSPPGGGFSVTVALPIADDDQQEGEAT